MGEGDSRHSVEKTGKSESKREVARKKSERLSGQIVQDLAHICHKFVY